MREWANNIDLHIVSWMDKYCQFLMRISLALIFILLGALKPLGLSPEEELIKRTVYWLPPEAFLPVLGFWEFAIGVCLLYRPWLRIAIFLLFIELQGIFLPLILLPDLCFTKFSFGSSIEGQYIIKNLFLVSAAFVIGSNVRNETDHERML